MNRSLTIYYSRKRVKARLLVAVEKFLISCVLNPFWSLTQKMCSKCVYVKYRQTKEKDEKSAWKKCRRKVDEVSAGFLFLYILDDLDSLIILISHLQIHYQKYVRQNDESYQYILLFLIHLSLFDNFMNVGIFPEIKTLALHITKIGKFLRKRRSSNILAIYVFMNITIRDTRKLYKHYTLWFHYMHEPRVVVNTNKFSLRRMFQRTTSRTRIKFILRYQSDSRHY